MQFYHAVMRCHAILFSITPLAVNVARCDCLCAKICQLLYEKFPTILNDSPWSNDYIWSYSAAVSYFSSGILNETEKSKNKTLKRVTSKM